VAVGLLALFLRNVDLRRVGTDIANAHLEWLALSLSLTLLSLVVRAYRWQYLLEPFARPAFDSVFRATVVGFAASAVLPARAGEVIRPYFLARRESHRTEMTATQAFATIILERLLDVITVLLLVASYIFGFSAGRLDQSPVIGVIKLAAAIAAGGSLVVLAVLFAVAGHPERVGRFVGRTSGVLPGRLAGLLATLAEQFVRGLAAIRRPSRVLIALALSFPLWLSISTGIFGVARAFDLPVPLTGAWLILAPMVLGVAVPTPGAIGGFHAAFRYGATTFFQAPDEGAVGAAIILHLFSVGPSLALGLFFAAQEGLGLSGMRALATKS
jgi:uncharacterized protein (TIRG00374 family)